MKTVEEYLKDFGITITSQHHDYSYLYNSVCKVIDIVIKDAVEEVSRWRDPRVEPPEDFEHVLVKYKFTDGNGNVQIGYDVDMFVCHEGDFHLIDNVIGWRPIE